MLKKKKLYRKYCERECKDLNMRIIKKECPFKHSSGIFLDMHFLCMHNSTKKMRTRVITFVLKSHAKAACTKIPCLLFSVFLLYLIFLKKL